MVDLVIKNAQVVTPQGVISGGVAVSGGIITHIGANSTLPSADRNIDAQGNYAIPGLIDPHVHLNSGAPPGSVSEQLRAAFPRETEGAAHGGVTTLGHFAGPPVGEDPVEVVDASLKAGIETSLVDFFFHGIVGNEETLAAIPRLHEEYGVRSFKHFYNSYKTRPGDPVARLPSCESDLLFRSLSVISKLKRPSVGMVHCEDQDIAWVLEDELKAAGRNDLRAWTEQRPNWVELLRMIMAFQIARAAKASLYVVHMASAEAADLLLEWRLKGHQFWGETCPHYLTHTADMESEIGCWGKVNTTIKFPADSDRLWRGIVDGGVTNLGTDNCGMPREVKEQGGGKHDNIWGARPGINGGMEHLLPVMMTFGVNPGRITIQDLARVGSTNTAKVFGLYPKKGVLAPGSDADIVLVDPEHRATISNNFYHSKADWTIYDNWDVQGMARVVLVRGQVVLEDFETVGKPGDGDYARVLES